MTSSRFLYGERLFRGVQSLVEYREALLLFVGGFLGQTVAVIEAVSAYSIQSKSLSGSILVAFSIKSMALAMFWSLTSATRRLYSSSASFCASGLLHLIFA